jgi:hypothetical protein
MTRLTNGEMQAVQGGDMCVVGTGVFVMGVLSGNGGVAFGGLAMMNYYC